jgi:uncharacterized protein YqgV (UPF0045/DUF77 family)
MDAMTEHEYVHQPMNYIVELEREEIMSLVHAAHMHAERLAAPESKKLIDSANRLANQAVYYQNG